MDEILIEHSDVKGQSENHTITLCIKKVVGKCSPIVLSCITFFFISFVEERMLTQILNTTFAHEDKNRCDNSSVIAK